MAEGAEEEDALEVLEEEVCGVEGEWVLEDELIKKPLLKELLLLGSREIFSSGCVEVEDIMPFFTLILIL